MGEAAASGREFVLQRGSTMEPVDGWESFGCVEGDGKALVEDGSMTRPLSRTGSGWQSPKVMSPISVTESGKRTFLSDLHDWKARLTPYLSRRTRET